MTAPAEKMQITGLTILGGGPVLQMQREARWEVALKQEGLRDRILLTRQQIQEMGAIRKIESPTVVRGLMRTFTRLIPEAEKPAYEERLAEARTLEDAMGLMKRFRVADHLVNAAIDHLPKDREQALRLAFNVATKRQAWIAGALALSIASQFFGVPEVLAAPPAQGPQPADVDWLENLVTILRDKPSLAISGAFVWGLFYGMVSGGIGLWNAAAKAAAEKKEFKIGPGAILGHFGKSMLFEGIEWGGLAAFGALGVSYFDNLLTAKRPLTREALVQNIIVAAGAGFALVTLARDAISAKLSL